MRHSEVVHPCSSPCPVSAEMCAVSPCLARFCIAPHIACSRVPERSLGLLHESGGRVQLKFFFFFYPSDPCFMLVLVYSCPEESAVRLKMTYSSSKASVVAAAAEAGATVDHMVSVVYALSGYST